MDRTTRVRRAAALCLVWIVVGAAGACSHVGESYKHTLRRWHRHAEVFDFNSLRAELMWDAVLVTDELRDERLNREAQLRHISAEETRRHIPSAWYDTGTLFFINFFAPRDAKDLLSADGYWHLELRDGAGRVYAAPVIGQIPITPMTRKLFPFIHNWAKTYIARFPAGAEGPLTLTLYGLNATSKLVW